MTKQTTPTGLKAGGKALWKSIADAYELRPDEAHVLAQACHTADLIDTMEAEMKGAPLMLAGSMDQPRIHPLIVEIRGQRNLLAAMLKQLKIPDEKDDTKAAGLRSVKARNAAQARWQKKPS